MKFILTLVIGLVLAHTLRGEGMDDYYKLGPDSLPMEGVPKGEIKGPFVIQSQAYPGTQHTYWVYVPAQYDGSRDTSLMIFNDGQAFMDPKGQLRAHNVMDNLIFRREIPVMIGVFINPGRTPEQKEPGPGVGWGDGFTNRGVEYNSLDDKYARVIVNELMPELNKSYKISKDPKRRGIGGASSGAIAAMTVAWVRPDQFHKVLSIVGSFTNIRGGHQFVEEIKKRPRKDIRVFFQDGRNDNRGMRDGKYDETWDWYKQNVRMVEEMTAKKYDINYSFGIGNHGSAQGGMMMPEMMRWLWRDHGTSTDPDDSTERSFNRP